MVKTLLYQNAKRMFMNYQNSTSQNSKKTSFHNSHALSPWFNIVCMMITTCFLAWILYYPITYFDSKDAIPGLAILTPQQLKEFSLTQTNVEVGLYIWDVQELDMPKSSLIMDATIWFIFDPRIISLERIGKFTFEKSDIQKKSEATTRLLPNNKLFASYDIHVKFTLPFNFQDFPFDDHKISLDLTNRFLSAHEAIFISSRSNLSISPEVHINEWNYVDREVHAGFSEDVINKNDAETSVYEPHVIFSIDYNRAGIRYIISIILPILMVFFITLFSFSFDPEKDTRYDVASLLISLVMALLAYRFVIENLSPGVGYFMISDYIFIFFTIATTMVFITNMFFNEMTTAYKKILIISLHATTILLFLFLLTPWK